MKLSKGMFELIWWDNFFNKLQCIYIYIDMIFLSSAVILPESIKHFEFVRGSIQGPGELFWEFEVRILIKFS